MAKTNQDESRHSELGSKGLSPDQGEFGKAQGPDTATQGGTNDAAHRSDKKQ